jgi:hypothetical protein
VSCQIAAVNCPSISARKEPERGVTEPVRGESETIEKELPLDKVPLIEVLEFTVPCTVSLAVPPPLDGVPYEVPVPEKQVVPVMAGNMAVSPGAGTVLVVWKNTANPALLITPGPDTEPPLPVRVSIQSPATLKGPPVQFATNFEFEEPQLMVKAQVARRQRRTSGKNKLRDMTGSWRQTFLNLEGSR